MTSFLIVSKQEIGFWQQGEFGSGTFSIWLDQNSKDTLRLRRTNGLDGDMGCYRPWGLFQGSYGFFCGKYHLLEAQSRICIGSSISVLLSKPGLLCLTFVTCSQGRAVRMSDIGPSLGHDIM